MNGTLPAGQARSEAFVPPPVVHTPVRSQHTPGTDHLSPLSSKLPFGSGQRQEGKCHSLPGQNFVFSGLELFESLTLSTVTVILDGFGYR